MFACKAAVKAGDVLVKEEMKELVNRLFQQNILIIAHTVVLS